MYMMRKPVRWDGRQIWPDNAAHKNSEIMCGFGGTQNVNGYLNGFY